MAQRTIVGMAKLIVLGMAVQLLVIIYVFYQSYQGRVDVIKHERAVCAKLIEGAEPPVDLKCNEAIPKASLLP